MASGSVQAAADNLGMTASAVSQHLSTLGRETDLVLFERAGRGIRPTAAAHALYASTTAYMDEVSRVDDLVTDLREGRTGRLSIGYFSSAGAAWMPVLAKTLAAEMPDLTINLVLSESGQAGPTTDLDLVIDVPDAPTAGGVRRVFLRDDPFVAVLPVSHPLAGREAVALTDLRGDSWVSNDLHRNIGHRIVVAACAAAGFTPRFPVQAQDHYTAIAFVAAGLGISVVPALGARALPPDVVAVPIVAPTPIRRISALVRVAAAPNRALERALELLTDLGAQAEADAVS